MASRSSKNRVDPLVELAAAEPEAEPILAPEDFDGIDISELDEETAFATVKFRGREMEVEYYPLRITPVKILRAVEVIKDTNVPDGGTIFLLVDVLKSWEVKRGKHLVPITIEGLQELPGPFLNEVWKTIRDASVPNETTSLPSRGFSARGATTATFRNGTA